MPTQLRLSTTCMGQCSGMTLERLHTQDVRKCRVRALSPAASARLVLATGVCLIAAGESGAASPPSYAMRVAVDPQAVAQARGVTVRWRDLWRDSLPQGWAINAQWKSGLVNRTGPPVLRCQGHIADLSSLTFRGGWGSRFDRIAQQTSWELTSSAIVLATPAHAQNYFNVATTWQTRYCAKKGMTIGSERFTSVQRVQPPTFADQQAEFRFREVLVTDPSKKLGSVVFFLRRGSVLIELEVEWAGKQIPATLVNALARKMAARAA